MRPINWGGLLEPYLQPLKERLGMLPLGQYEDGSVRLAWPGMLADTLAKGQEAAETPIPPINDDEAWKQKAVANFDATSLAPLGGVLGAVDNAVGSAGGKLMKGAADQPQGIRAYHGSPHDFDRFDLSKIGTGEGAQAYGHGLYFADSEDVARSYRDALSADGLGQVARGWLRQNGGDMDATLKFLRERASALQGSDEPIAQTTRQALAELEAAKASGNTPGRMYEVNIKANPEDFLDWDKPLSKRVNIENDQQRSGGSLHQRISEAESTSANFGGNVEVDSLPPGNLFNPEYARELAIRSAALPKLEKIYGKGTPWDAVHDNMKITAIQEALRDPATIKILREAGIPGIKYLDGMSRGAGEGSSNYVVFDDNLIEILRKYANPVTGAIPGLAAQTQDGTDPQTITTANILKFLRGQ